MLMEESSLPDFSFQNFLSKIPVLGKQRWNNIQEAERKRLIFIIYFLKKTIKSFSPELDGHNIAFNTIEKDSRFCFEKDPISRYFIYHCWLLNVAVEQEMPSSFLTVKLDSFFMERVFHFNNRNVEVWTGQFLQGNEHSIPVLRRKASSKFREGNIRVEVVENGILFLVSFPKVEVRSFFGE